MKEITIEPMEHRPVVARDDLQAKTLSKLLEIARIDHSGEREGSISRKRVLNSLPIGLGASKLDDWKDNEFNVTRLAAKELLLSEAIESTTLIQEQVQRTVVAGAEKFKVIRDAGTAWYNVTSNALRVPLGETQRNAAVVPEGAEIKDRTEDYDKRSFDIVKYGVKPRITFEMIEDGLIDVVSEEIFYAGAALENKLNYDALTALATNAGNVTTQGSCGTAGTSLNVLKQGKKLIKGFFPDTLIIHSDMYADLMLNANLTQAMQAGGAEVIRSGRIPEHLLGVRVFETDNGSTTVDGTNPWGYDSDNDVGGILMEARRGCGIAMRRDRTIREFDDIVRELRTITATMRVDVNYLHADAVTACTWQT